MRYFGGLTAEKSGIALNLEINAVRRRLRLAEAWIQREMDYTAPGSQSTPANWRPCTAVPGTFLVTSLE